MKLGGYDRVADGFTIVEVMIVLAVSSLLLISAAALINGRQDRTEFTTAIHDQQEQLQQIINETASGYYPNGHDFTCHGSATGPVTFSAGASDQGTNAGCIFLGKVMQFGLASPDGTASMLGVLPVVGNQYQNSGGVQTPVLTVTASVPRAAYPINSGEASVPTTTKIIDTMEYGLHIATSNSACGLSSAVCYKPVSGGGFLATGMAAFITGDSAGNITATASGSTTDLQSGSQQLSLYGVKNGSTVNRTLYQASNNLGNVIGPGNLVAASEVLICIASGSTGQSGLFTIGGNAAASTSNSGLGVTLSVKDDSTC